MNEHLDKYLCEKYPKIFADRDKSPKETCMCWGFPGDGWFFIIDTLCSNIQHHIDNPQWVEKSDALTKLKKFWNVTGWNWVFYRVAHTVIVGDKPEKWQWNIYNWFYKWFNFDILYEKPKTPIPQVIADQVKEKFGTLRFYYHGGDEYIRALVSYAETLSCYTCEDCGAMDVSVARNGDGWIRTTCERCTPKNLLPQHKENRNQERALAWEKAKNEKK